MVSRKPTRRGVGGKRLPSQSGRSTQSQGIYEQDVLHVGKLHLRGHAAPWDVTPQLLDEIAREYLAYSQQGGEVPVVWDHSESARDCCGKVVGVQVVGDRLRARFRLTDPAAIRKLDSGTVSRTSVGVWENWRGSDGRTRPVFLDHLGLVMHPADLQQEPVRRVASMGRSGFRSRSSSKSKSNPKPIRRMAAMADDDTGGGGGGEGGEVGSGLDLTASEWSVADAAAFVGKYYGVDVPSSPANIGEWIEWLATPDDVTEEEEPEEPPAVDAMAGIGAAGDDAMMAASMGMTPAEYKALPEAARKRFASLQTQAHAAQIAAKKVAENAFLADVNALVHDGRISPADKAEIMRAGKLANYDLGLLAPYRKLPISSRLPTRRVASQQARAGEPKVGGDGGYKPPTAEEAAEATAKRLGKRLPAKT